jgi:hypothetical protein
LGEALPRNVFEILVSALGDRNKAEHFSSGIESLISEQGKSIKSEVKDELRQELVTRELFLVHAQLMEDKFKAMDWKINVLVGLVVLFGTFLNPTFLAFLRRLLRI